ncbi:hypothetical protein Bbelb_283040 [Branchiostoma belcheri]|nr:hypothetical protein Bbelb_283040 [Branchiostoma belcheri]
MVQNSSKALMWEGLCHLARRDCVREGDGPASIGTWQLDFVQFLKNKHHKYFIIAHQCLQVCTYSIIKYFSGTRGFLPARLRHGLIWNRTGNIKGGPGRDVGLDLINEFLNNDFKEKNSNNRNGNIITNTYSSEYLRPFFRTTKEMTPSHRLDLLTDAILHYTRRKSTDIVDCWNVERKLGDDMKYVGKKEHMGHILPSLLNFPFEEIVPDVLHMVVVWAINQRRTDELMRAMKDTGVPCRIMETAGDDGKGSARTWTQLNGKEVIRLRAAMVDEWLNNESKYKAYVPDINFRDEAPRYLLHQFDGDMGDLMATADFLRRTINIVSTGGDEDSCFIIVEPSDGNTALDPATGSDEGVFRDEESSITPEDLDRAEAQLLQFGKR